MARLPPHLCWILSRHSETFGGVGSACPVGDGATGHERPRHFRACGAGKSFAQRPLLSLGFAALQGVAGGPISCASDNAEITFGITSAQWLLALGMFLILAASVPETTIGRVFDCAYLTLSGLTGPFSILLLPIAAYSAWKRKEPWRRVQCAVLAACAMLQLWALVILDTKGRPPYPAGYSAALLARMLAGNIFAGALLGRVQLAMLPGTGAFVCLLSIAIGGVAIMTACFMKTHIEMRLLLVFTCIVFACSLLSPKVTPPAGATMWELMTKVAGIRYWFFPSLAFAWTLAWCARSGSEILKATAAILFCVMFFGVVMNWKNPAYKDLHFDEYARVFEAAPAGTVMMIPENPQGWYLELVKHASR